MENTQTTLTGATVIPANTDTTFKLPKAPANARAKRQTKASFAKEIDGKAKAAKTSEEPKETAKELREKIQELDKKADKLVAESAKIIADSKKAVEASKKSRTPKPNKNDFPEHIKDLAPVKDAQAAADAAKEKAEILDIKKLTPQLEKATAQIRKKADAISQGFHEIGMILLEVREKKLYLGDTEHEFKNVYEYAEVTLGFKKSSTANYIGICERFCETRTGNLLPEYKNFSYTQLAEALPIADLEKAGVTPDKTVKEIRSIRKELKKQDSGEKPEPAPAPKETGEQSESSEPEEPAAEKEKPVEEITLTPYQQKLIRSAVDEIKSITFDKPFFTLIQSQLNKITFVLDGIVAKK